MDKNDSIIFIVSIIVMRSDNSMIKYLNSIHNNY